LQSAHAAFFQWQRHIFRKSNKGVRNDLFCWHSCLFVHVVYIVQYIVFTTCWNFGSS